MDDDDDLADFDRGDERDRPDDDRQPARGDDPACAWLPTAEPVRSGPGYEVYSLLPRTNFSWTNLGTGTQLTYELGLPLDLVAVPEALLVVRIHAISATTGRATFVLEAVSRSDDAPEVAYVSAFRLATIVIDATSIAGTSVIARARCDLSTLARARIHLDQLAGSPASATLSAELVARAAPPGECRCPTAR